MRKFATAQGRWLSPDPAGLAAANPANPQSWNRYAYVLNSPMGLVDPSGLQDCSMLGASFRGGPGCQNPGPGCVTSYCPTAYGGMAWNDPVNPTAIMNAGEQAFQGQMNALFAHGLVNRFGPEAFAGNNAYAAMVYVPGGCVDEGAGSTPVCDGPTSITQDQLTALIAQTRAELTGNIWSWSNNPYDNAANALVMAMNKTGIQALADPRTYLYWYGGSLLLGGGGAFVVNGGVQFAFQAGQTVYLNPNSWVNGADFISGWTPGLPAPNVWGLAGETTYQIYDWSRNH